MFFLQSGDEIAYPLDLSLKQGQAVGKDRIDKV
jgi:hypothetical protein